MQDFRKPSIRGKAQAQSEPSRTPQARIDIRELVGHHRQITKGRQPRRTIDLQRPDSPYAALRLLVQRAGCGLQPACAKSAVDSAWVVNSPTIEGAISRMITSLELFDTSGGTIARMLGSHKPGIPEDLAWRRLVTALAPL